jgi:hypothetical protein
MKHGLLGIILTPATGTRTIPGVPWCADNGCYTLGDRFDGDHYLRYLDKQPTGDVLFATAPDVVGDAVATLERSADWYDRLVERGYPPALVAQDGIEDVMDQVPWGQIGAWFVGGTTAWKESTDASQCTQEAQRRGLWTHMGRVNSLRRLRIAARDGYDTVDGNYLAFGPDKNLPSLLRWMDEVNTQDALPFAEATF